MLLWACTTIRSILRKRIKQYYFYTALNAIAPISMSINACTVSKFLSVLLAATILSSVSSAQIFMRRKARKKDNSPSFVLIQLGSGSNRIEYLAARQRFDEIKQIRQSWHDANDEMIRDFRDNFKYCPFYFFYDSCRQKSLIVNLSLCYWIVD